MTLNLLKFDYYYLPNALNGVDGYLNWARDPILELKVFNQEQVAKHIELDYDEEIIYTYDYMDGWKRLDEKKKTIHEWQQEYDFAIMDPDGFDRTDPKMKERLYTRKEFEQRAALCTVVFKGSSIYDILKEKGMKP